MSRRLAAARVTRVTIDLVVMAAAFLLSFLIRFDGEPPSQMLVRAALLCPFVVGLEYAIHRSAGAHRFSWRHFGLRDSAVVLGVVTFSSALLVAFRVVVGQLKSTDPSVDILLIPFGVIAINYVVTFLALTGVRAVRRLSVEHLEAQRRQEGGTASDKTPTMLVGAGQAGALVARELSQRPDLGLRPVGFLDDDVAKFGTALHGVQVVGTTHQLVELCEQFHAEQILITIPNATGKEIRRIARLAEEAGVPTKIVPGINEIVGGNVSLTRIRDIAIEDLLRRAPVVLDTDTIRHDVRDKNVMVTGAAGSIGSELCRQLLRFEPRELVLVDQSESGLFFTERELLALVDRLGLKMKIRVCVADVTHERRCAEVFMQTRPWLVFHAAAYKHVPMMERDPGEAVRNNVLGTQIVADLSHRSGAKAFVLVSTDKAVNPSSVMGATKRVAERYVQDLARRSPTRFVTVRFGNVLGSVGSVVPIFQEQILRGGPVTVTHPDMQRYFMTIPEAAQLVVQAGIMGDGGEIFILDMGEPVRIVDLAKDLIRLYGYREGEDIEVEFSGVRPGEKLYEELSTSSEQVGATRHPKIFVRRVDDASSAEQVSLGPLFRAVDSGSPPRIRSALKDLVAEYAHPNTESVRVPRSPAVTPAAAG